MKNVEVSLFPLTNLCQRKPFVLALLLMVTMAVTPMPATAANLIAYYPADSFYYVGTPGVDGVPKTPNLVAGFGDATMQYSGGLLYQNSIDPNGKFDGAFLQAAGGQARLTFGNWSPFTTTDSFTYALWIYTPVGFPSGSVGEFLLSKFSANTLAGCEFKILLRGNDMQFITINTGGAQVTAQTAATINTAGVWNHIAVTAAKSSGNVTWGAYVNGSPISVSNPTQQISSSASTVGMSLGMPAFNNLNFAPAGVKADEIRFYDGVLSQAELLAIIPEPSVTTLLGLGFGLGGLVLLRLRRR